MNKAHKIIGNIIAASSLNLQLENVAAKQINYTQQIFYLIDMLI